MRGNIRRRDIGLNDQDLLRQLPGLHRINDHGKTAEIFLRPGADPQEALRWLVDRITVRRFDYREPSLHEIFVRTVEQRDTALAAAEENA